MMLKTTRYILTLIAVMILTVGNAWGAINPTTPTQVDGVYQIGTAEELWGFAQGVNNGTIAVSANAVLTDNIDMGGSSNGSFPGIGKYTSPAYAGTFDGQGHTISNFYISQSSSNAGLFSYTDGATIKNFNLSGEMTVSGNLKHGSVVGWAMNTTIEKVYSSVTITASSVQQVGGLVGSLHKSTAKQCRYSGNITSSSAFNKVAGLSGSMVNGKLIDCLFDGTLTLSSSNSGLIAGGLVACSMDADGNAITNCLMNGTINISNPTTKCGVIIGYISKFSFTCSNTYYNSTTISTGLTTDSPDKEGTPTWSMSIQAVDPTVAGFSWGNIKNNLNNGSTNWGINGDKADYPLPNEEDKDKTPVTKYTITFNDWDGTQIQSEQVVAGTNITRPSTPTRQGYYFDGWTTDGTNIVDWPRTATKNETFTAKYTQHSADDYENGFKKTGTSADADYYEVPALVDGDYQIDNAGKLWWFAKYVNTSINGAETVSPGAELTANAVLTADIDMGGSARGSFPGIGYRRNYWDGTYKADGTTKKTSVVGQYAGTFDGQGHTISNFYMSVSSSWKALFNLTSANATIKNFTIKGDIAISGGMQIGAVIGRIEGKTTLEDIHSSVTFTVADNKTISAIGGIVGQSSGETSLNRCRFSGEIKGKSSYNALGGIIGNAEAKLTFNNCLFDGTISTISTPERTGVDNGIKIGGIFGRNNNISTITNCLSHGTISVPDAADKGNVGILVGTQINNNKLTITNTFYSPTTGIGAVGNNSNTDKSTAAPTELDASPNWETIKENLNGSSNPTNWGINSQDYPVPGEVDGNPKYTITFNTDGGSEIAPIKQEAGTSITKPEDPTKTGYTFKGWKDAGGNDVTFPFSIPAQNTTLTAKWTINQYTISFNMNGATSAQIDPIKQNYGTSITKPTDPTKDGWYFNGWSPEVPSTMPAENKTCVAQWTQDSYDSNGFNTNASCATNKKYEEPVLLTADRCTTLDIDASYVGYYEVKNAGNMFWIAQNLSADNNTRKYVVTADIDMDGTNHKDWPGIGAWGSPLFGGTFDGNGHPITNYYMKVSDGNIKGMFAATTGGTVTIKNFSISGTMEISTAGTQYGVIVGRVGGTKTTFEDIHSSVNITVATGKTAKYIGGFIGNSTTATSFNRCRYSGTITANAASGGVGGFFGFSEGAITMDNCLFDGTITSSSNQSYAQDAYSGISTGVVIGGLGGATNKVLTITNSMSIGTVTIDQATDKAHSGIIIGANTVSLKITITNTYYRTTGSTTGVNAVGTNNAAAGDQSAAAPTEIINQTWSDIKTSLNGSSDPANWGINSQVYPVPGEKDAPYKNGFKKNGTSADLDYYERPGFDTDGTTYIIDNGGKLFWFAHSINGTNGLTQIAANSKAKITQDIDLEGRAFPGFKVAFTGQIDGQGNTISGLNYSITTTGNKLGVFNELTGTLKNFTISGTVSISGSASGAFVGSLVGYTNANSKIEDVTSSLTINISSGVRYTGGIVGAHGGGTINRCRFNGTITVSGAAYNGIGGIIGEPRGGSINNSLFDGVIDCSACTNEPIAGGIVGGLDQYSANPTITNCFSYGVIKAPAGKKTKIGAIVGYVYSGKKLTLTNIYHSTDKENNETTSAIGSAAGTVEGSSTDKTGSQDIANGSLKTALNNGSNNWKQGESYPLPGVETTYTITFETNGGSEVPSQSGVAGTTFMLPLTTKTGYRFDGWNTAQDGSGTSYSSGDNHMISATCTLYAQWTINQYTITFDTKGGTSIAPITQDYNTPVTAPGDPEKPHYNFIGWDKTIPTTMPAENMTITATYTYVANSEGIYEIGNKEDFFNFVTVASTNASAKAKLTADIDLEDEAFNGFTGYTGTFDGNKKTISGYKRTLSGSSSLGFFNTTSGATIKDLTLEGEEIYNINSACYAIGGVIGMATNTTIEGVTSKVKMTFGANCPSGTGGIRCVGGLVGRINGGSINKCRYNGLIDLSANSGICDRFGGIVGDLGSASTISNCLFDGEIKVAATSNLAMGGILGTRNSQTPTIQHCLFNGKMTFPAGANVSNCGPISGGTGVTASDSYYDMIGFTVGGVKQAKTAVQQSSSIERTTQPWLDILVALNNGSSNWGIHTETYPVPGDKAAVNYTINFDTNGGTPETIDPIVQPEGSAITAPTAPTKTGYDFAGWNPELPATMPNGGLSVTATWTLAEFKVYYYVDNTLYLTVPVKYTETITPLATPTKDRYTFSGWSEIPATMPANDVRIDGTFTFTANASGVYEIGNREDYVNFVNITKTNAAANAKVIDDINFNSEPVEGIGSSTNPYTGTFDGQGHSITGYVRNVTGGNYGGMFNYTNNAIIRNFSLAGAMSIAGTGQQYGSVVGAAMGTTKIEDVHSSVNVTITSTAAQVGGFVGRAASTINRCSYSGIVSTSTAYDKIGGFAGSILGGTVTNCLFDGTLNITTTIPDGKQLTAGGFTSSFMDSYTGSLKNSLVKANITISNPNTRCGVVAGLIDRNSAISNTYYITNDGSNELSGIGEITNGAVLTGNATPVGSLTWNQILICLNPTTGTDGNWEIKAGKDYPVPSKCTITEHQHSYINGFCISGDAYEPATKAQDGYYEIDNAGKLWWIAQQLNATENGLPKNTRIKLTADIDMERDRHGSFPGICPLGSKQVDGQNVDDWEGTAFQGIFDGQGKTINNYYRKMQSGLRQGLFNVVYNEAQVKNFDINGEMIVAGGNTTCALMGVVVGVARGTSTIEDINSNVNITASGSRGVGGIVGCLENTNNQPLTKLNRCRYNGIITVSSTNMNDGIGGIAGEIRSAIMTNVLFDGQIIVKSGTTYKYIGGVVGVARNNDNSEIHRALSHGTITLTDGYVDNTIVDNTTTEGKEVQGSLTGIFIGGIYKTLYMNKCFHTTTRATENVPVIGPQIHEDSETVNGVKKITHTFVNDLLLGSSTDMTGSADLYSEAFHTTLGKSNWEIASYDATGAYPKPKKDAAHIHYYVNGFCTAGDGEYEQPTVSGKSYIIDNGGKLYWFAEHFNNPGLDGITIPQDATVELKKTTVNPENTAKVIDMEGDKYIFPGIGSQSRKFMGTFTGHGFTIKNFKRDIVNSEFTGLINYSENAEIREFQLEGQINYNLNAAKSFHGTVVGYAAGTETLIENVFSFVEVRMNNNHTRVWGGIAGRASGRIHCCRYSGIVAKSVISTSTDNGDGTVTATTTIEAMASGEQIGGICGNAQAGLVIEDCLFDGTIKSYCYDRQMRVAGILASNELESQVSIQIKNCLFNGCLDLQHLYEGENKETKNGIIAGYWDTNKASLINNVYYLKKCADVMSSLEPGNYGTDPIENEITQIEGDPTDEQWNEIFDSLDEKNPETNPQGNGNWTHGDHTEEEYPTPGGNICNHENADGSSAFNEFGYCTICGEAKKLKTDEDGKYIMEAISDLAGFRDLINSGTNGADEFNAKLTEDIDFANWEGDFGEPIGNSHFNRYLYNFDGQGHKLLNVKITTTDEYVGFFGFAGDNNHDCYIHDFTITGEIVVPYDSKEHDNKPLYMGVVGKMYRGKIENVHSELVMKNENPTRAVIGGILGAAETTDKANPVTITKCSYTGTCEANAVGKMGGIIGETSKGTVIDHCTFAGTMDHVYQGINNSTSFGGIVGYNADADFSGVQNCIIAGVLKTRADRTFSDYGTEGNHKNVLCGEDKIITDGPTDAYKAKYSGNYAWNAYSAPNLLPSNSIVYPGWIAMEKINNGELCAIMNAQETSTYVETNGYPWGQILGYQVGISDGNGGTVRHFTDGSPAMRVPLPGYQLPDKITYAVTATINDDWNAKSDEEKAADSKKYDYTAAWYYFDDQGDTTPYPSDAASMKVKKIEYHRAAEHLTGYNSFCLPFDFTQEMKPTEDSKIFKYGSVNTDDMVVLFTEVKKVAEVTDGNIPAGTPFILQCNKDEAWDCILEDTEGDGYSIALQPNNPTNNAYGLYGSYNTILTGAGYWKIHPEGNRLVKTVAEGDSNASHCYPYRAYLKLDTSSSSTVKEYVPMFEDGLFEMELQPTETGAPRFNLMGQKVDERAKGIIIMNGRKVLMK